MINKIKRMLLVFRYNRSERKRKLDEYMKRIRQLEPLSDEEWKNMKVLASHEKMVLDGTIDTPGFDVPL
jgi:hypothetical protein